MGFRDLTDVPSDWSQPALRHVFRQALLNDVRIWLTNRAGPDPAPVYTLIDAGQLHLTAVDLVGLLTDAGLSYEPLLRHTPEAEIESVGPYLVNITNVNDAALEAIVGVMEYGWVISFLSSRLPDFKLHTHLRACLNAELENGTAVHLRYYDSRVMSALLSCAPESLRDALLEPIDIFALWDRNLRWQTVTRRSSLLFRRVHQSFILSDTLVASLGMAAEADLIHSLIAEEDLVPGELDAVAPHLRYQIVANLARRARAYGLTSHPGIRLFCAMGLRNNFNFDHAMPVIARALSSSANKDDQFRRACTEASEAEWRAIEASGMQQLAVMRKHFATELITRTET